jgi:hypothetical protein
MKLNKNKKYIEGGDTFQWSTNVNVWFEVNGRRAYCDELFQEYADNGLVTEVYEPFEGEMVIYYDGSIYVQAGNLMFSTGPCPVPLDMRCKVFRITEVVDGWTGE